MSTARIPEISLDVRPTLAAIEYADGRVDLASDGAYLAIRSAAHGVVSLWIDPAGVVLVPGLDHGEWTTCHALTGAEQDAARTLVARERTRVAALVASRATEQAAGVTALAEAAS